MADLSNKEILDELGVDSAPKRTATRSPREERIIAGFEEIQRFVEEHGHPPIHGEDKDIFERLYATRLDQIIAQDECRSLVEEIDHQGLLAKTNRISEPKEEYNSNSELLKELGIEAPKGNDITKLKHVKSQAQKKREKADEIGTRELCNDFDKFKPLFEAVQEDLKTGRRKTLQFSKDGSIEEGNWFILSGQKAFVASIGDQFISTDGRKEYRLRVIFDNGVESNQLMRSLQKRLWEDDAGRRISDTSYGPLFDGVQVEEDFASGTIYVLRSKSDHPTISENRNVIHKIGVTGGKIETRISNAKLDPTFLMAEVEIVASYELYNINRSKLEGLIHKFFAQAKLNIEIFDRFGKPVSPKEWFLVPIFIIDEVVARIKDNTLSAYKYDIKSACLVKV